MAEKETRVLLVEQRSEIALSLQNVLGRAGFRFFTALNREEFLRFLLPFQPNIVLLGQADRDTRAAVEQETQKNSLPLVQMPNDLTQVLPVIQHALRKGALGKIELPKTGVGKQNLSVSPETPKVLQTPMDESLLALDNFALHDSGELVPSSDGVTQILGAFAPVPSRIMSIPEKPIVSGSTNKAAMREDATASLYNLAVDKPTPQSQRLLVPPPAEPHDNGGSITRINKRSSPAVDSLGRYSRNLSKPETTKPPPTPPDPPREAVSREQNLQEVSEGRERVETAGFRIAQTPASSQLPRFSLEKRPEEDIARRIQPPPREEASRENNRLLREESSAAARREESDRALLAVRHEDSNRVLSAVRRDNTLGKAPKASFSEEIVSEDLLLLRNARAFHAYAREKNSGVLVNKAETRKLFFSGGFLLGAASADPRDHLALLLYRRGRLSKSHYEEASRLSFPFSEDLARELLRRSLARRAELEAALQEQREEILVGMLEEECTFQAQIFSTVASSDNNPMGRMILEGIRRKISRDVAQQLVQQQLFSRSQCSICNPETFGLTTEELALLQRVEQPQRAEELCSKSLSEETVYPLLVGFEVLGLVQKKQVERSRSQNLRDAALDRERIVSKYEETLLADYFSVLGVSRDASMYELQKAYRTLLATFSPESFQENTPTDVLQMLGEIRDVLDDAFAVLSQEEMRDAYVRNLAEAS